ncbi:MAG: STAS domain-containing protein [Gammaproteobacteria bacterium]|nr:STAS domain-containing protein [Gammaproteobacteria bacterium]
MILGKQRQELVFRAAKGTLGQILNPFKLPDWLPELKNKDVLRADFIAGLTVALVLIPQSMAYAQLAGLPPYYGLYASLIPTMIAAFFGSSRQLATGPVAMVSLMTAAALEPLATAGGEAFIGYAFLLSLMVGLFQLMMGMFRLGVLLNFLSHPVIAGFVNAAAIIIATSQLGKIFGVSAEKGEYHYEFVFNTATAVVENIHWPTLGMAALAFGTMLVVRRYNPKLPAILFAVILTTVLAWLTGYEKHTTIKLEQIASQNIRTALLYDALESKYIDRLTDKYIAAQKNFGVKVEGADEDVTLLSERQDLEQIKFQLDQKKEQSETHHKGLFDTPLYATGEGEQMRFFTAEEIANSEEEIEGKVRSRAWYITNYENSVVELQSGGKVIGKVPGGLPGFRLPTFEWSVIMHLIGAMITISLIGFMEAISIAKAMAAKTRQSLNPDRELMGQGLSNIAGSMFQAYPVSGSFSRSAVNINTGAVTGFSSVITVFLVAFALLFLTPLLYYLPQATLAAIIIKAVAGLISMRPMIHAWRANRHDGIVAFVTFALTLALAPDLELGILFGMLLSLVLLLFRIMKPRVMFPGLPEKLLPPEAVAAGMLEDGRVMRMRFEGSLVFANVAFFEEQLQKLLASSPKLKVLIIDAVSINEIDASGDQMLRDYYRRLTETGLDVLFTRVRKPIQNMFERSHMYEDVGRDVFHRNPIDVYQHAWDILVARDALEEEKRAREEEEKAREEEEKAREEEEKAREEEEKASEEAEKASEEEQSAEDGIEAAEEADKPVDNTPEEIGNSGQEPGAKG